MRHPFTTCPESSRFLVATLVGRSLAGMPDIRRALETRYSCTHVTDMTALALGHVDEAGFERLYDIAVDDEREGRTRARIRRDGQPVHEWIIARHAIVEPAALAGRPMMQGFFAWRGRPTDPAFEAATMLQRLFRGRARFLCRRPNGIIPPSATACPGRLLLQFAVSNGPRVSGSRRDFTQDTGAAELSVESTAKAWALRTESLHGSCLCGAVRYAATGPARDMAYCHCRACAKETGVGFGTWIDVPDVEWKSGASQRRVCADAADGIVRSFCATCAGRLPAERRDGTAVLLPAGGLDSHSGLRPARHDHGGSPAGCPPAPPCPRFRIIAAAANCRARSPEPTAAHAPVSVRGSCLCAPWFRITSPPFAMRVRHCSRCRKRRAAAISWRWRALRAACGSRGRSL